MRARQGFCVVLGRLKSTAFTLMVSWSEGRLCFAKHSITLCSIVVMTRNGMVLS